MSEETITVVTQESKGDDTPIVQPTIEGENKEATPAVEPEKEAEKSAEKKDEEAEKPLSEKAQKKVNDRMNELTKEKYEAIEKANREETARVALEKRLAELETKIPDLNLPPPPNQIDYATDEEYRQAVVQYADYVADTKIRKTQETEQRARYQQEVHGRKAKFINKIDDFKKANPEVQDFEAVTFSKEIMAMNQHNPYLFEAVEKSEFGPEIGLYLGKNLGEADRLARLHPMDAAKEIWVMEQNITKAKAEAKPKVVSSAGEPITPVGSSAEAAGKKPEAMTYKEYEAMRMKQLKKGG